MDGGVLGASAALTAAAASIRPQPAVLLGMAPEAIPPHVSLVVFPTADCSITTSSAVGLPEKSAGAAERSSAASPAPWGEAMLVPVDVA